MMLEVPVRGIGSIDMQLNTSFEYLDSLLPVEVVITNESGDAPFEIMKPILVMTAVTTSLLVEVPEFC